MEGLYKILGQGTATSSTAIYTVPRNTSALVSSFFICNSSAVAKTFSIRISRNGEADNAKQLIFGTKTIGANDSLPYSIPIPLSAGDQIKCIGSTVDVSFNFFGQEFAKS